MQDAMKFASILPGLFGGGGGGSGDGGDNDGGMNMAMSMMKRKRKKMRVRMKMISIKKMSSISRMHLACKFIIPEQIQLVMVEACLIINLVVIILLVTNLTSLANLKKNNLKEIVALLSLKMILKEYQCLRCQSVEVNKD